MFFLNLNLAEFLGLLGTLGGVITALYLLDRGKRRKIVSTLRFWTPGFTAAEQRSRKRMREPWSLILQLLSLLLLLLAVGQLEWGTRPRRGRDHVLLLDVSSWSAGQFGAATALDRERRLASQYVAATPRQDRVMIVRAGALMAPVTSFTGNREALLNAINSSSSGFSALNMEAALSFAQQAQSWSGGQTGEIVYVGPARVGEGTQKTDASVPNLRILPVSVDSQNCGIRSVGVRRSEDDSNGWQATVAVRNYGSERHTLRLKASFAGTVFAPRVLALAPATETIAEYSFSTSVPGHFVVETDGRDSLSQDDRVMLALPRNGPLRIAVYTLRSEVLRPLLESNRRLSVQYFSPASYSASIRADITVLDGFAPRILPQVPALLINAPEKGSPVPVKSVLKEAVINGWHAEDILGSGLHARDLQIPVARVFQVFEGDVPVATTVDGPVIVARPANASHQKFAVLGFDPLAGSLRYEVTTPLLFANLIRWLAPESFHVTELTANHVGEASVSLDRTEQAENRIRVTDEAGWSIPFTLHHSTIQLFSSRPGIIHVNTGSHERILSLTLPDVGSELWNPGKQAATGLPAIAPGLPAAADLWKWLAILGGFGLLVEYYLYGRRRAIIWKPSNPAASSPRAQREFVTK